MTKTQRAVADAIRSVRVATHDRRLIAEAIVEALEVSDHEDFILLCEGTSDLLEPLGLIDDESDKVRRGAFNGQPAPWKSRAKDDEEKRQSKPPAAPEAYVKNEVATEAHDKKTLPPQGKPAKSTQDAGRRDAAPHRAESGTDKVDVEKK